MTDEEKGQKPQDGVGVLYMTNPKTGDRRVYTPEEELKIAMMDKIIADSRMDIKEDGSNERECAYRAWLGCRSVMGYSNEGLIKEK